MEVERAAARRGQLRGCVCCLLGQAGPSACLAWCVFINVSSGVQEARSSGVQGARSSGDQEFRRPRIGQETFREVGEMSAIKFEGQVGEEGVSPKEFVAKKAGSQRGWQDFSVEKCVAE